MIHAQLRGGPFDARTVTVFPAKKLNFPMEGRDRDGRVRTALYECCDLEPHIYEYKGYQVDPDSLISVKLVGGPCDGATHGIHPGRRVIECALMSAPRIAERIMIPKESEEPMGRYEISFEDPNIFQWVGWHDQDGQKINWYFEQ